MIDLLEEREIWCDVIKTGVTYTISTYPDKIYSNKELVDMVWKWLELPPELISIKQDLPNTVNDQISTLVNNDIITRVQKGKLRISKFANSELKKLDLGNYSYLKYIREKIPTCTSNVPAKKKSDIVYSYIFPQNKLDKMDVPIIEIKEEIINDLLKEVKKRLLQSL